MKIGSFTSRVGDLTGSSLCIHKCVKLVLKPDQRSAPRRVWFFYEGQRNNKNKNKTYWVMHEYELKQMQYQRSQPGFFMFLLFILLSKSIMIWIFIANVSLCSQDILDPNRSSEPEASRDHDSVHNHCSAVEMYGGRSNQHNMVNEGEGSNASCCILCNSESKMPDENFLNQLSMDRNGTKDDNRVWYYYRYQYSTIMMDYILYYRLTYLQEGNTQQCFSLPCIGSMMASSNSMEKSRKRPHRI
ncbi:hypothetical protein GQ457_08G020590 [Hibiscus cannabinus]